MIWLPPLVIFGAFVALAAMSFLGFEQDERAAFERESRRIEARLIERVQDFEQLLRSGAAFLNNSEEIDTREWRGFVADLGYDTTYPGVSGLGFSPHVPAAGLEAHLRRLKAEIPGYTLRPTGKREAYCPLIYMEPLDEHNRRAIGFDLYSEPTRREALNRARDTGEAALTGRVSLVQDGSDAVPPSCLLYLPVYNRQKPVNTPAQRRAALRGFVSIPFRVGSVVAGVVGAQGMSLGLEIYDGPAADAERLLYRQAPAAPGRSWRTAVLQLHGRQWTLVFTQPEAGLAAPARREPPLLLLLGAMLAGAVFVILHGMERTRARADSLALQMTRELRESELYNRAVFQNSSVPIGVAGPDGRFVDANPALLELTGYQREEFLALHLEQFIHPDFRAEIRAFLDDVGVSGRDSYQMEQLYLRRDGSGLWLQVNVGVSRGEGGAARLLIGAVKDISAAKSAEEAESRRRALYQSMFEDNRAVCLLVDPASGAIRDANHAAAAFYGYTRAELKEATVHLLHTLPREEVDASLREADAQGGVFRFMHRLKNGSLRNVDVHTGPFDTGPSGTGGQRLLLSTVQDVTERVRAEAELTQSLSRFQDLVESTDQGVVLVDLDDVITYVNPAFAALAGLPAEELLGRPGADFIHPEDVPARAEQVATRRLGSRQPYEIRVRRPDGALRRVRVMPFPLYGPEGAFRGGCGLVADITEQHAAREAERQRQVRRAALLRLHEMHQASRQELLDFALEQILLLTGSPVGYIYGFDEDTGVLTLHAWSSAVEDLCAVESPRTQYRLDEAGLWGEPARLRQPVIINDYTSAHAAKRGCPAGHMPLSRFLSVPVMGMGRVLALAGVANKEEPYTDEDATQLTLFTDGLWNVLERQEAGRALLEERRRLSDVVEGTNAGTWEWDIATGALAVNSRWAEIMGYGLDELSPVSVETWEGLVNPDDQQRIAQARDAHFAGLAAFLDCEARVRHKEGHWAWVHVRGRVFRRAADGEPLSMSGTMSDISERKLAEERLALVARFPVENPNPVLRADKTGRLLYANPAAAPLLGSWGQQVGGRLPRELRRELRLALDSGQARASERSYTSGIYSFAVTPFVDKGYVNIYAVDVTQRKNAETALRLSELRYRELAVLLRLMCDNVPDMIWAKDMEGRYLFANKATCEQYLGAGDTQAPQGRTDRPFLDALRAERPEDPCWHTLRLAGGQSDLENGAGGGGRYEECGRNRGRLEIYEVRKAPFVNDQGVIIGSVGAARNITERKKAEDALAHSEERFRTMAQVSPVGIFQSDARARCIYVNEHLPRIIGYTREEVLGSGWLRTLARGDRKHVLAGFRQCVQGGRGFSTELHFRGPGGRGSWALLHAAAMQGADGTFAGFVGVLTDITERKRSEDALRMAKAEAEAATLAKAQFLANMSHEIRTPLSGVIGTTRLLSQTRLDEEQRRLAEMAVESGRALLEVVNDILDFSKIEVGRMPLRPAPFALRRSLAAMAAPFALLARERGLDFTVEIAPETPDALVGDEARLGQVLRNLLSNALKFTESGGIRLEAAPLDEAAPGKTRLRFRVTDTGLGIEPGYLPRIFESFSQADSSYSKQFGGTGLGLAICKSLVQQMGGTVQVESSPGKGSAFSFTAVFESGQPAPPSEEATADATALQTPPPAPQEVEQRGDGGSLRVLLAEDNAIGRVLMEHILQAAGHSVTCVGDGLEVLAALKEQRFHLVLMDVQMPRMDGVTATRKIRQGAAGAANAGIAIIALSAYASKEDRQHFLDSGMDAAVPKPAEEEALFAAMRNAMEAAGRRSAPTRQEAPAAAPDCASPPMLDEEYLARAFGGHPDLLRVMLRQFLEVSLPELEQTLDQALRSRDLAAGRTAAHRARGTLGAIGAARAAALAAEAEKKADGSDAAGFAQNGLALLHELATLKARLAERYTPPQHTERP
jgi:PAS domain S-box-containing protein